MFKLELPANFQSRMYFLLKTGKAKCCNNLIPCLLDLWILWNFNSKYGLSCISISITCYDGIPVSAQNSHQTIHDPSSRFRDRHQYYHERKKTLAYAFVPTFFFAKLVITLDLWPFHLYRKNSRSSEITQHCLFTKSSFSRFLWIWSSSVTLY